MNPSFFSSIENDGMSAMHVRAFVRDVMSADFRDNHLERILCEASGNTPTGEDTLDSIVCVLEEAAASPEKLKGLIHKLTHIDYRRLSKKAIKDLCKKHLLTASSLQTVNLVGRLNTVIDSMACQDKVHYHIAFVGPPGVGKSTATIMLLEEIIMGKFTAGKNKTLQRQLQKQQIEETSEPCNYIYLSCEMTIAALQKDFKEQYANVDTVGSIILIVHLEECDKLSALTPAKRKTFVSALQTLVENSYQENKKWVTEEKYAQVTLFVWTGNYSWDTGLNLTQQADLNSACAMVHKKFKDTLGDKFADGGSRMPEQGQIILLPYVAVCDALFSVTET